ncbi:class I SAM-dependent DNA methyltransferase [Lacticaseibacillus zhaodongensis]|uniref:class I SAM-dependent DNA methyltransferase n=1 Tax=Lacticaseibacillus zhaodongensis TaxID=2668065 RepID=UPI0012D30232|nr:class I SAM-dependent methyltransferase [Lacticaseibacillus zhaodongensis]
MIYSTFAQVYDQLMDQDLYDDWAEYVEKRVQPQQQELLELAGGSGTLAVKLAQAGYKVTNLDLSADMLALAADKINAADVDIPLIQADMRDFGVIDQFDLVTCFDDSICYMQNLDDVKATFAQVAANLKSGGRFMFDAHSIYQMDEVFPGYMYNYQTEDYAFLWSSYEGEYPHSCEHDLTFFIYREDIDAYKPLIETHKERTYPINDFVAALEATGFTNVEVSADFGKSTVKDDSTRWFFSAVKQ